MGTGICVLKRFVLQWFDWFIRNCVCYIYLRKNEWGQVRMDQFLITFVNWSFIMFIVSYRYCAVHRKSFSRAAADEEKSSANCLVSTSHHHSRIHLEAKILRLCVKISLMTMYIYIINQMNPVARFIKLLTTLRSLFNLL